MTAEAAGSLCRRGGRHHSAGGVVVHDGRVLLIQPRPGRWQLPKGHIEAGEDSHAAAEREVAEETGVRGRIVASLGAIDFTYRSGRRRVSKRVDYFLMEYAGGDVDGCDRREVEVACWMTAAEALELLTFDNERDLVRRALAWPGEDGG